MPKLVTMVANPHSIFLHGDFTIGYTEEYKKIDQIDSRLTSDLDKIQRSLMRCYMVVSISDCFYAWNEYSSSLNANWIMVPEEPLTIVNMLTGLLVVKE